MKKLVLMLALLGSMNFLMVGCTMGDSQPENGEEVAAENTTSTDGSGELEALDGESGKQAENSLDSELPGEQKQSELDQAPPPEVVSQEQKPEEQQQTAGVDPGSENKTEQVPPPAEQAQAVPPPEAVPPVDTPPPTEATTVAESKPAEAAPKPSLKKIKDMPFREGDQLLNAVYVARPKDTFTSISKMVYGDASHVKALKASNPAIKSVRPGDKVYYNSPQRPTDESMMKVYYEDVGQVPETYTAKEGDDLKKISRELLGYPTAWKEVWAINPVESKDKLADGTTLRYWKGAQASNEAKPADVAAAGMTAPPPPMELPPPPPQAEPMAMPPPPPQAAMPPPPPMPTEMAPPPTNMGSTAPMDVPPPSMDVPPPPPMAQQPPPDINPPPAPKQKKQMQAEAASGMDDMMLMGAVGVLVLGIAAIVVIRKRKQQKEMAAVFNENTQIGA